MRRLAGFAGFLASAWLGAAAPAEPAFTVAADPRTGALTSLRCASDPHHVEFLRSNQSLGAVVMQVRTDGGAWRTVGPTNDQPAVRSVFRPVRDALRWEIVVTNTSPAPLEIGDLALPLPFNTDYVWDHEETFVRRVFKHAFIAGHGSFLYWLPVSGDGPMLLMVPVGETHLEYFTAEGMDYAFGRENFRVFVHSTASAEQETRGTWRQPRTACRLAPGGTAGYAFDFVWADSYQGLRDALARHGGVDVTVAPGMVVPRDLEAHLALRTTHAITSIEAEFPGATTIVPTGRKGSDTRLYRITFRRLGENRLTVRYANGRAMPLEYFVTEPLETLIRKRANFIVRHQQHRDPSRWYDGLFSLWDRNQPDGRNLLGPDQRGGQHPYAVSGSDDPCNGKCLLVAEKNVAYPDADEIAALEYFVDRFVWGRQQRTDREEPYPYGIYGADSWHENRFTDRDPPALGVSRPGGPSGSRMWRSFDYPTYFALYFDLYRIGRQRPDLLKRLTAEEYLERAYGTARAYFEVPAAIRMEGGWSFTGWVDWQYTVGNFHEKYLLPLIRALAAEGWTAKAERLRGEWEKKVKYFIYDSPWPFASEMPIDSTAYESTYAAAHDALEHPLRPDERLWEDRNHGRWFSHPAIDPARHRAFLERQHRANLACRGVLESHYWSLGSDFRGCGSASYTLSYMTPMGGWAVLDYALRHAPDPALSLRLGYAAMLGSWALMNTGDAASSYGFWRPGKMHDGAMSWGFQPRQIGTEWNPATRDLPRGAWPICGEADHGLVAAIETARTIIFDDPLFGLTAYGGTLVRGGRRPAVIPRDGVRQRFSAVLGPTRLHVDLDRDGFAADRPIEFDREFRSLRFALEDRAVTTHRTQVALSGLPAGEYEARIGGTSRPLSVGNEPDTRFAVVELAPHTVTAVEIRRR